MHTIACPSWCITYSYVRLSDFLTVNNFIRVMSVCFNNPKKTGVYQKKNSILFFYSSTNTLFSVISSHVFFCVYSKLCVYTQYRYTNTLSLIFLSNIVIMPHVFLFLRVTYHHGGL